MKQREDSFRLLFDGNPVPMVVYSRDSQRILAVNDAAVQHYGYTRAQFLSMSLRHIHDCDSYAELESLGGVLSEQQVGRTWKHLKADGARIDVAIFARALTHENVPAALIAAVDITERKRAEARVAHMAHHDALTGLPTGAAAVAHGRSVYAHASYRKGVTHCIDLDTSNRSTTPWGTPAATICCSGGADRGVIRDEDTAARLGGDELPSCRPMSQSQRRSWRSPPIPR